MAKRTGTSLYVPLSSKMLDMAVYGKNKIGKNERLTFIKKIQNMVYAQTESALESYYNQLLKLPEATKYKHFIEHVRSVWDKRHAWAHCYRVNLPTRGNHTNNYAEAGIRFLKEIIFSQVKAYNLVQMFSFVHEVMEIYYQKKLPSLANNRIETYVALRFQGINAQKLDKDEINITEDGWYTVQSQTVRGEYYSVNTTIGFSTCPNGTNGSPCVHQAAVVIKFGQYGINYVCSTSSSARKILAQIALGECN